MGAVDRKQLDLCKELSFSSFIISMLSILSFLVVKVLEWLANASLKPYLSIKGTAWHKFSALSHKNAGMTSIDGTDLLTFIMNAQRRRAILPILGTDINALSIISNITLILNIGMYIQNNQVPGTFFKRHYYVHNRYCISIYYF